VHLSAKADGKCRAISQRGPAVFLDERSRGLDCCIYNRGRKSEGPVAPAKRRLSIRASAGESNLL